MSTCWTPMRQRRGRRPKLSALSRLRWQLESPRRRVAVGCGTFPLLRRRLCRSSPWASVRRRQLSHAAIATGRASPNLCTDEVWENAAMFEVLFFVYKPAKPLLRSNLLSLSLNPQHPQFGEGALSCAPQMTPPPKTPARRQRAPVPTRATVGRASPIACSSGFSLVQGDLFN
jgi:hypothetical protein